MQVPCGTVKRKKESCNPYHTNTIPSLTNDVIALEKKEKKKHTDKMCQNYQKRPTNHASYIIRPGTLVMSEALVVGFLWCLFNQLNLA